MTISDKTRKKIDAEIAAARNDIRTDKLDMSYGELANLYENHELVIRPEYQRLFRWTPTQKSRFIESILLGFPTPAIFVAEDDKGVWELVDGLQRVSSVLEFMGVLKDAKDATGSKPLPGSVLVRAGHKPRLPSIDGVSFSNLSLQARLSIKRAGCRVEVIKVGSHPKMKYEVFERLNTGGSSLEAQEVRNCVFRATNPEFVEWVEKLAAFPPFQNNLGMSEFQASTMFDRGLILRYFTLRNAYKEFEHDVEPFITDFVRQVLENERDFDRENEDTVFKRTFKMITEALGEDSWRHYHGGKHKGPLSVYVFETLSVGISRNLSVVGALSSTQLKHRIVEFKQRPEFVNNTGAGANIKSRLLGRMDFAVSFFSKA
jgi:hypothetical protein